MYGSGNATTIINNCDSYIYLGGMDLKTAQNMSLRLNRPLEDILYMPIGQEVVIRRGQRPIITRRYDIQKNELYQEITKEYNKNRKKFWSRRVSVVVYPFQNSFQNQTFHEESSRHFYIQSAILFRIVFFFDIHS